ncbi:MAG: hypothetical protein ACE5F1_14085 [Planctomycetota bacterium]
MRALVLPLLACLLQDPSPAPESAYARWSHGPSRDPGYFPIAVWLQDPSLAPAYEKIGINLYVGLWKGPTRSQLDTLRAAGMPVICAQNELALAYPHAEVIRGWLHRDEPDNAQPKPGGGYGPPVTPKRVQELYRGFRQKDATRPVFLNLGQGVANDRWIGRGVRTGHLEDYPAYVRGADIVSFDIYPVASSRPEVHGKLELVARGVARLVDWTKGRKIVWNCIECTRIKSESKPTPAQVRAEVWMSLIHGSKGILYFVHEWVPKFNAHALLDDPVMRKAVAAINARIHSLARVLNSPNLTKGIRVRSTKRKVPIAWMAKKLEGSIYLFCVSMRPAKTRARFRISGLPKHAIAEVLDEDRKIEVKSGKFEDDFEGYDVRLYRIE